MPLVFTIDIIFAFAGVNMNFIVFPLLIVVAIVRLSDRKIITDSISTWLKGKLEFAFPDIFQTGAMPTERFLLITVPMIIAAFVNIKILDFVG